MTQRRVIETYYQDLNNLVDILGKLTNSYRLLIGGADELNRNSFSNKDKVKDALDRVDEVGEIIDEIIDVIDTTSDGYLKYTSLKSQILNEQLNAQTIRNEIEEELKFKD